MKTKILCKPILDETNYPTNIIGWKNKIELVNDNISQLMDKYYYLILISLEDNNIEAGELYYDTNLKSIKLANWIHINDDNEFGNRIYYNEHNCTKLENAKKIMAVSHKSLNNPFDDITNLFNIPIIPENYIKQFIDEYNNNKVNNVYIKTYSPQTFDDDIFGDYSLKPKLTKEGFITIVNETDIENTLNAFAYASNKILNNKKNVSLSNGWNNLSNEDLNTILPKHKENKNQTLYTEEEVYKMCKASFEMHMSNDITDEDLIIAFEEWFNNNKK